MQENPPAKDGGINCLSLQCIFLTVSVFATPIEQTKYPTIKTFFCKITNTNLFVK